MCKDQQNTELTDGETNAQEKKSETMWHSLNQLQYAEI